MTRRHAPEKVPTGNTYDKYGSRNPVVRWLMRQFEDGIFEMLDRTRCNRILDVGCGEGLMAQRIIERYPGVSMTGLDLEDEYLQTEWERRKSDRLSFRVGVAEDLPFQNDSFDTVTSLEVLEHVESPETSIREMARVSNHWLVLSVPREPLWRGLNLLRGAYVTDLGNTPGHVNHWSKGGFIEFVSRHGRVVDARSPIPWTVLLVDVSTE